MAKSKTLNALRENGTIRNISRNNCMNERVYLEIEMSSEQMKDAEEKGLEKVFQLTYPLATSNMIKEEIDKYENKRKNLIDELKIIESMEAQDIWIKDLDALEKAWDEFPNADKENIMSAKTTKGKIKE
nr:4379_t:CDS:2 [Entrophospora candida]